MYLLGLLLAEAWFFWNPSGWEFNWGALVTFVAFLAAYVALETKCQKDAMSSNPNDMKLFKELVALLQNKGTIDFIKNHDFGAAFHAESIEPLRVFHRNWNNVEHEFLDQKLEKARKVFLNSCDTFLCKVGEYTFPIGNNHQKVGPHRITSQQDYQRIRNETVEALHGSVDNLVSDYETLVRLGRKKIHIPKDVGD